MVRTKCGHQIVIIPQETDRELLERVRDRIVPDRPLAYIKPQASRYSSGGQYRLVLSCKEMCDDLEAIGFRDKTGMPGLSENLIPHFIRGYF